MSKVKVIVKQQDYGLEVDELIFYFNERFVEYELIVDKYAKHGVIVENKWMPYNEALKWVMCKKLTQSELDKIINEYTDSAFGLYFPTSDLRGLNFSNKDCGSSNFDYANLEGANFSNTILEYSTFRNANLRNVNFENACLLYADFRDADLTGANLNNAMLDDSNIILAKNVPKVHTKCPKSGSFIGYKPIYVHELDYWGDEEDERDVVAEKFGIMTLKIPSNAERISGTEKACRCNKAKIIKLENLKETEYTYGSDLDDDVEYTYGDILISQDFCKNKYNAFGSGIVFFMTKEDAVEYIDLRGFKEHYYGD